MTAAALLKALENFGQVTKVFSYPYVKVTVCSDRFAGLQVSAREEVLAKALGVPIDEIRRTAHHSLFLLQLVEPTEPNGQSHRSTHWLAGLTESAPSVEPQIVRAVHFYGYKGGQARSTVLAVLAITLARDGWKVLVIDADVEAPSLDTIFAASSKSLSSTLLGISQGFERIQPLTVYAPAPDNGEASVALVNCWPRVAGYDIDAAALALRTALEPTILESALRALRDYAHDHKYDLIIVDHRTGLSPSILPSLASLPGPLVITVRMDEQWQPAKTFLGLLLKNFPPDPGLFVIWKPDAEEDRSFQQRTYRQREELLDVLAEAYRGDLLWSEDDLSADDLQDHLVVWPYDEAFRSVRLPEPEVLGGQTKDAIARIRSLLGLGDSKHGQIPVSPIRETRARITNISGAKDQGDLIVTRALRELLTVSNPYTYILGRKGTGKTRLARELSARHIGEPLLVPDDSEDPRGIKSTAPEIQDASKICSTAPERFWLALFGAALQLHSTTREQLGPTFLKEVNKPQQASDLINRWSQATAYRTFLLDSLETTFSSRQMVTFLDGLFRVLSMIETDSRAAEKVGFRLFLRRDLAQRGFLQNMEQQLFGKTLELSWDYQSILNFTLSRISLHPWYAEHFQALVSAIETRKSNILAGEVGPLECETLLEIAFPETVRRNNLRTTTFFRTYFADTAAERAPITSPAGSDPRRYYPRVFDEFIRAIPEDLKDENGRAVPATDEKGKVHQVRIFRAHEKAAESYLQGLKQELAYVVDLSADFNENQEKIDKLLNSFEGLQTPFQIEKRVEKLSSQTGIEAKNVRGALEKMKDVGMFEARPDYPGEWRVGRLFKSSLRMKYVRGRHYEN